MDKFKIKLIDKDDDYYDSLNIQKYQEDINQMKKKFEENTKYDISEIDIYENDFTLIDMTINQFRLIYKLITYIEKNSKPCIWLNEKENLYPERVVKTLANNFANTLWITRMLLSKGSDHQAKILFRNYVEQSDILIAVLGDFKFFEKYVDSDEENPYSKFSEKWFRHLRPKMLKPTLNKIYNEVLKNQRLHYIMPYLKKTNYEWLSLYTHGDFDAIFLSSFVNDEDGDMMFNEFCSVDFKINITLNKLLIHSGMTILPIFDLLENHHNIKSFLNKDLKNELENKTSIYQMTFFKNIKTIFKRINEYK